MKCYLTCPSHGTLVKINFERSSGDGRIMGVSECNGFEKTGLAGCDKTCVELLNTKIDDLRARYEREQSQREEDPGKGEGKHD